MEKFTIKDDIVFKNNKPTSCPIAPIVLVPNNITQEIEQRTVSCNTACPHCNRVKMVNKNTKETKLGLQLRCVVTQPIYELHEENNLKISK